MQGDREDQLAGYLQSGLVIGRCLAFRQASPGKALSELPISPVRRGHQEILSALVIDDGFVFSVPLQLSADLMGNECEVTGCDGTMRRFRWGHAGGSSLDAVDEIPMMARREVGLFRAGVEIAIGNKLIEGGTGARAFSFPCCPRIRGFCRAAIDPDPAFFADPFRSGSVL